MGARGNSGVILSQIVRGVADVLAESTNGIDPLLAARALRGASDAAYRAVRRPVEGTMLSVIRELAEEAERRAASRSRSASCSSSSSATARRPSRGRPSSSTSCGRRGSSTRVAPGSSSSCAGSPAR